MTVPFLDLQAAYRELKPEIDAAVARVLEGGTYILGAEVEAFEEAFADYVGASACIGVGNGFDALALGLKALGVGPGDEVIVPTHTFIATWLAVSDVGAVPVGVDPREDTFTLDPTKIEAAISHRTRAVIPVHLYGHPADLDPILKIAREHGLRVLEDAAQAHGARYKGCRIGAHGDLVAWSFYPGKNLGAMGDAGGVTTDDPDLAERLRMLRNYGSRTKYWHELQGRNSRMDPVQAAVLSAKLPHLDDWNGRRRQVADFYREALAELNIELPREAEWAEHVYHLFVIRSPARDRLQEWLAGQGIATLIHYPFSPAEQQAYREVRPEESRYPGELVQAIENSILSLPIGPHFESGRVVSKAMKAFFGREVE